MMRSNAHRNLHTNFNFIIITFHQFHTYIIWLKNRIHTIHLTGATQLYANKFVMNIFWNFSVSRIMIFSINLWHFHIVLVLKYRAHQQSNQNHKHYTYTRIQQTAKSNVNRKKRRANTKLLCKFQLVRPSHIHRKQNTNI